MDHGDVDCIQCGDMVKDFKRRAHCGFSGSPCRLLLKFTSWVQSWRLKTSKNCSGLTCDSPRACRFYNHSPSLSPSHSPHSPRSPSHSPFTLNLLHRMQRQRGHKMGGASPVPSLTPFRLSTVFWSPRSGRPSLRPRSTKPPFLPSRSASFPPPPECNLPRTTIPLFSSLRPSHRES